MRDRTTSEEVQTARRYFGSFAEDYHRAFQGAGRELFQGSINRLFRKKTFQLRTHIVSQLLSEHGIDGKRVLDLGCGSGEVSILAATLGAHVTGLDIVPQMIALAQQSALAAGVADLTEFRVSDIMADRLEPCDVTLLVGVIEYYRDLETLLRRASDATRELLIIADTRGPWWRRLLRRVLARVKRFNLYYRSPAQLTAILARSGFAERARIPGHSFTVLAYNRVTTISEDLSGVRAGSSPE